MSLQIRRGTAAELANITPVIGELIYTTDTQAVFVGDGSTAGGIAIAVGGSGNVSGTNLLTAGIASATGNVYGNNIFATGFVSATGNVTGNYLLGNGALLTGITTTTNAITNGTSAVSIGDTNGNANISINGTSNVVVVTNTTVLVTGLISATGNLVGNNISGNTFSGNIVTAAQPNITSLGTLSALTATGNITGGDLRSAGLISAVGNVDAGNIRTSGAVTATGNVNGGNVNTGGQVSATGNIIGSNINTSGLVSATGNIIGGNINTTGTFSAAILSASGNITGGNIRTAGLITATGNIDGANLTTGGRVLATGNVTGGNITTGGIITAIGNVIGQNFFTLGQVSAAGNITAANFTTSANISAGNIQLTGIGTYGELSVTGNALVSGNLTVDGTLSYVNVTTLAVEDPIIGLGRGANNTPLTVDDGKDRGEQLWYYSGSEKSAFIGFDNSSGKLLGATDVSISNEIVTVNAYGNAVLGNIESQGTISAVGNITGGNILTAGLFSVTGNVTGGNLTTAGLVTATGNIQGGNLRTEGLISATGAITGAAITGTSLTVSTGNVSCGNIVNTNANGVGNIGSASTYFNTVFATATSAQYADLAEAYLADADYEPGTVVMFGGAAEITQCGHDACTAVVGVVSTKPAYLMNSGLSGDHVTAVALMGRVPCKVQGSVSRGALMVSAGNGRARSESNPAPGTIIGKAVEAFSGDVGTIEILVGRV